MNPPALTVAPLAQVTPVLGPWDLLALCVAAVTLFLLLLIRRAHRQTDKELRHKTRLYDFLTHVNRAVVRSRDANSLMDSVCQAALEQGQFKRAWVAWHEATPVAPEPTPAHSTPLDSALHWGQVFCTHDLAQLSTRPDWAQEALDQGLRGCVTVPLHQGTRLLGHLILLGKRVNDQASDLRELFENVAKDLSFALTHLHREQLQRLAEERIRLHAAALESTQDGVMVFRRDNVLVSVNPAFTRLTGYTEAQALGRGAEFLLADDPQGTLASIRSGLIGQGSWQDEVAFQRQDGDVFATQLSVSSVHNDKGRPTHFVGVFTDITPLKRTEARLARMAHFDPLTDLPNRLLIHERLAHALSLAQRHDTLVGVLFIDLDNFKTVNDGLGHAAGDNLLQQVATRLRARTRQEDTLGRLGGDEFILVLEHLKHPQQASQVAAAILDTLGQPFTLDTGEQVYVRASIGISLYPHDGPNASELIRNADAAMYESKRKGRNNFSVYTKAFTKDANSRLHLETRLRRAIEQGDFELHYQPLLRLSDHQISSVEALVRLRPEEPGQDSAPPVRPDHFIRLMEDTGMIEALSEWVLRTACEQGQAWLKAGLDFGSIAVNISPNEILRGGVVERVARILEQTGLPPHKLDLEITESGLMESGSDAEHFLRQLHALGVALSIDDFGTGYSSLAYLKRFPVHQLKIDRSFIEDLPANARDAQLVSTMIAMARGLRLSVVAEGVETAGQAAFLIEQGCDFVQGFFYSHPLSAPALSQLLARPANHEAMLTVE